MSRTPDDTDPNADWLTTAHLLCTDHGIAQGHISVRLEALREKLATQADPLAQQYAKLAQHCTMLEAQIETLRTLTTKVHSAKGRYHTQIAMCDLFDAVDLPNERPMTPTRASLRDGDA